MVELVVAFIELTLLLVSPLIAPAAPVAVLTYTEITDVDSLPEMCMEDLP